MKVVIAGISGLIGRSLARALLQAGHRVVGLTTSPIAAPATGEPSFVTARWDGITRGDWTKQLEDADAVVNLAGQSLSSGRWTRERKRALLESRLHPTKILVESIRPLKRKPGVFVSASAVGYYGPIETGDVSEDHPAGSDFLAALCSEWEKEAMTAVTANVRTVVLRTGVVLDPSGGALPRMVFPYRFFVGGTLGDGRQWLPWIHREDQIRAIIFAIERLELSGPVNLVAPGAVTMSEFSRTLGRVLHRPSITRVPSFMLRILLGEMAGVVLTGQKAVPSKLVRHGFTFSYPELSGALADLLRSRSSAS